ncbi:hypothetical protein Taro_044963 [Colocasia esculenta]|uniref:Cupin type-1 domain-containing protein n=1 Tax=Colocasia esculenta TaxID=4460 RepID=A0A843WZA2_COLES|nr:hypothetical protein [Colocasia esculenta]
MAVRLVVVLPLLALMVASSWAGRAGGYERREEEEAREQFGEGGGGGREGLFMMERSTQVVKTEAGEVRVVRGLGWKGGPAPLHMGFISMEPNSLFLPHYMDASLILFIRRGDAKVGLIYEDGLVEKQLGIGDLYWIPAGSTFYIANTGRGQRLQIICSIDTSESLGLYGSNPTSVLAGFDVDTLAAAFNVTSDQMSSVMRQRQGAIIYMTGDAPERAWISLPPLLQSKVGYLNPNPIEDDEEEDQGITAATDQGKKTWTWRKFLSSIVWKEDVLGKKGGPVRAPDSYNIYDRSPDFSNSYGWSVALDKHDYAPLKYSGVGVYLVNLTAGSMMAPHVNPTATEYGVVLRGTGRVQVVFPNGTSAMDAEVSEGDAFWVPRHFPFCHVASRSGPMEFFGFTTSARRNRPQFLVGASSILQTMMGPEMAAAFGTTEERLRAVVDAQRESIILPPWPREHEMETVVGNLQVTGSAAA